ncbi:MAG TPA: tRNA 4-thiouridine(8) synthase ThiI, partial [Nitrospinaceae bacterium]|nr:tRNA 4-thiouridine(8) synthase ThiI [Nitrospinaceae bacterium]
MKTKTLLIRYDEIGLKGRNRRHFENQLVRNIRYVLRDIKNVQIDKIHGRILGRVALAEAEKCTSRLTQISGIASISIGNSIEPDFDKMAELGVSLIHEKLQAQGELKFCVRTRRSNKAFPFTSKEVDFEVGSRIMETLSRNGLSVDINGAEFILEIEIGPQETIVFDNRVSGLSGLP